MIERVSSQDKAPVKDGGNNEEAVRAGLIGTLIGKFETAWNYRQRSRTMGNFSGASAQKLPNYNEAIGRSVLTKVVDRIMAGESTFASPEDPEREATFTKDLKDLDHEQKLVLFGLYEQELKKEIT